MTRRPDKIGTIPIFGWLSRILTDLWSECNFLLRWQHSFFFLQIPPPPLPQCVPVFSSSHLVTTLWEFVLLAAFSACCFRVSLELLET